MKRHWKLTVAIVGILVLAGAGIGLAVGLSAPSASRTTSAAAAQLRSPQQLRFTKSQQLRLEQGITAPTVTAQARILASEVRSQFEQQGKPLLPAGSHVTINDATFHVLSAQLATVDASVSGPSPGRWQFVLVREAGQWLLLGTGQLS
jgi:hypothetical protein